MKPSVLFENYKVYLIKKGRVLTKGSLLNVRTMINNSERSGMNTLTQSFIDRWCAKRETESISSCQKRRGSIRYFLQFSNSMGYTNLQLPPSIKSKIEQKTIKPMTQLPLSSTIISDYLDIYIRYLQVECHKVCGTTHKNLIRFNNFLAKSYPEKKRLSNHMVQAWCNRREAESNSSRNTRVLPIRNFLKFAVSRGFLNVTIPDVLPENQISREPHIFSDEELKLFFQGTVELSFDKREYDKPCVMQRMIVPVYFRLLYSTGMRTNEARELRCEDVDLINGVISIVNTKGLDQHKIALHPSMLELLRRYNKAIDKIMPNRKVFFPTEKDTFKTINWQAVVFKNIWRKISSQDARSYDFRSNYAVRNISSWSYEGPAWFDKLIYLSRSMGHKKIESTCYYYHLSPLFPKTLEEKSGTQMHAMLPDFDKFYEDEKLY